MSGVFLVLLGLGLVLIVIGIALFKQMAARNTGTSNVGRKGLGKDLSEE